MRPRVRVRLGSVGGWLRPRHHRPVDPWPPAIHALAEAVVLDDWLRLVATWERFRLEAGGFYLRWDTGLEQRSFLVAALGQAHDRGLLRQLAKELIKEELVTDEFGARLAAATGRSAFGLQAFQNGVFRPFDAVVGAKDMLAACDQVCRIDVDGQQIGTGVQVSQTLVATAAHVVWKLTTVGPDGCLQPTANSIKRLSLTFGDAIDYVAEDDTRTWRREGEPASLHPDWLAWSSQPTTNERASRDFDVRDVTGIDPDTGPWDLALIRLAEPRPTKRRVRLLSDDPPADAFAINILHHPHGVTARGEPLLCSPGQLDDQIGTPPVRFLHDADTLWGSSGARCSTLTGGWSPCTRAASACCKAPGMRACCCPPAVTGPFRSGAGATAEPGRALPDRRRAVPA